MFQDYALFPHLNVYDNVAFGLRMQRFTVPELGSPVKQALQMVGMDSFASRHTGDLSGGEQQRVALARTIAARPQLLLLDEPLAALDRVLRKELLTEIRQIIRSTGIPAIYVTHDQEEAYLIADRVLLIGQGSILQSGTPAEVYQHPVNLEAAQFLGLRNTIPGVFRKDTPSWQIRTEIGTFTLAPEEMKRMDLHDGEKVTLLIRGVELVSHSDTSQPNRFIARVLDTYFQEDHTLVKVAGWIVHIRICFERFPCRNGSGRIGYTAR